MPTFRGFQLAAIAVAVVAISMPGASRAYTPEQEQACTGDAMRLCSAYIPDVDRITACMVQRKAELSPQCRVFFRSGREPSEASAARAGKPMSIKPAAAKTTGKPASTKAATTSKSKKPAKPAAT
jgi:hypothetical protein